MVSGPLGAMLLADLGADVIKVEHRSIGDRYRWVGSGNGAMTAAFSQTNRGKRSICIDLGSEDGAQLARNLAAESDVVIQNFRPGVATRLGIGPTELLDANANLIYVTITGFGPDGPYADQKVYDYVIQALTGMAALQEDADGRPSLVKNIVIDKVTAYTVAQGVTAALFARERGHGGQHIEISMLEVGLAFMWPDAMSDHTMLDHDVTAVPHMSTYYEVRPCADGFIAQMAISDRQFPGLCDALGTEAWLDDPRFATMDRRIANAAALGELIELEFAKHRGDDLVAALHQRDVPAAVIRPLADIHLDPQVRHNGTLVERQLPTVGLVREPRSAVRFETTATTLGRQAPKLGEHTEEILAEFGSSTEEIDVLIEAGTVGPSR